MTRSLKAGIAFAAALAFGLPGGALAHTPVCACYDNGDGSVLCEGGFSDGATAAGVAMLVRDAGGATLIAGAIDANGEFEFEKPDGFADVLFDGGEGHQIVIPAAQIY
ncbi:MAG: hypothetical protein ACFCUS_01950 [Rubrimonas sp.]|uniref:hypothetical protein n=1 Tax=Rubrimonas sp. TaxID=2036015 RepID=UPI002FDCF15D